MNTITTIPTRITADHYQMPSESESRKGTIYDLRFDHNTKHWTCNCFNYKSGNHRCKHIRRLVEWIAEQKAATSTRQEAEAVMAASLNGQGDLLLAALARLEVQERRFEEVLATANTHHDMLVRALRIMQEQEAQIKLLQEENSNLADLGQTLLERSEALETRLAELEAKRNIDININIKQPATARRQAKATEPKPRRQAKATEPLEFRQVSRGVYECIDAEGVHKTYADERSDEAFACTCEKAQRRACGHMKGLEKYLQTKREEERAAAREADAAKFASGGAA